MMTTAIAIINGCAFLAQADNLWDAYALVTDKVVDSLPELDHGDRTHWDEVYTCEIYINGKYWGALTYKVNPNWDYAFCECNPYWDYTLIVPGEEA